MNSSGVSENWCVIRHHYELSTLTEVPEFFGRVPGTEYLNEYFAGVSWQRHVCRAAGVISECKEVRSIWREVGERKDEI